MFGELIMVLFPLGLLVYGSYAMWQGVVLWKSVAAAGNKQGPNEYADVIGPALVLLLGLAVVVGEIRMVMDE